MATAEQNWIARAKAGDTVAFGLLVEEHQKKVYHLALRMVTNPDDAQELAQEAFLKAWRSMSQFQGDSSFATWMYRLTHNLCIDFLRREQRRKKVGTAFSLDEAHDEGTKTELPDSHFEPQRQLEQKELREQIAQGLSTLSPEHKEVLILREINGLSYQEISDIVGVAEGTVKSRIARARLVLRNYLIEQGNFSSG